MKRNITAALAAASLVLVASIIGRAQAGGNTAAPAVSRPAAQAPAAVPTAAAGTPQGVPVAASGPAPASFQPVVNQYCVTCHNDRLRTGGLSLQAASLTDVAADAATWEKVIKKLRGNMMPPANLPRPEGDTLLRFASALESSLDVAARTKPQPGRTLLHRLNRAEYAAVIKDLLALDLDPATLLPPDDSSYGFDNIADVLGISPLLIERYIGAAEKISALAVGDPRQTPAAAVYRLKRDYTQTDRVEGLPIGTRGGTLLTHNFPLDGEYVIKVRFSVTSVGFVRGLRFPHEVVVTVDGQQIVADRIGGPSDFQLNVINPQAAAESIEARFRPRVRVKAGPRPVAATFLVFAGGAATGPEASRPWLSTQDPLYMDIQPTIERIEIEGPYNATAPTDTPSRNAIFTCRPRTAAEEPACARTILGSLARRAYRRPVVDADIAPLLALYREGRTDANFDAGIQLALQGVLTNPEFLFRMERDPAGLAPGAPHQLTDLELASRLSFFLWSSIPDEPLLQLAAQRRLREPRVLEQQVTRMLADPRSSRLVDNFGGQWLQLRNLAARGPAYDIYPDFDDNLRQAMRRETELLLDHVFRGDRNVNELLTANYTFVNERLARHYGMRNVYGPHFRRVGVIDTNRIGLLGHGSVLTLTAFPDRTAPVLRGKWILENVLGTPPPPPPPDVNTGLAEDSSAKTMRERMQLHRANAACASCHRIMDPLGFALENYDMVGGWRVRDRGVTIDPTDVLADGTKVDGPVALRRALTRDPAVFATTVTEKLMTYALGRGIEAYDQPVIRQVVRAAAARDYRFSSIVLGIVSSVPFQMRSTPEE